MLKSLHVLGWGVSVYVQYMYVHVRGSVWIYECITVHVCACQAEWAQHVNMPADIVSVNLITSVDLGAAERTDMTSER